VHDGTRLLGRGECPCGTLRGALGRKGFPGKRKARATSLLQCRNRSKRTARNGCVNGGHLHPTCLLIAPMCAQRLQQGEKGPVALCVGYAIITFLTALATHVKPTWGLGYDMKSLGHYG